MVCPFCGTDNDKVIETRLAEDGRSIRRRRECNVCIKRFTTYEKIEMPPISVRKKDGTIQPFRREKIRIGLERAFNKRPVSAAQIDDIVSDIEYILYNKIYNDYCQGHTMTTEVSSDDIGNIIMQRIKTVDEVAYVRFVSVNKTFNDIDAFLKELNDLKKEKGNDESGQQQQKVRGGTL